MPDLTLPLSPSNLLALSFACALLATVALKLWLTTRQTRHVATHRDQVPLAFAQHVTLAAHQKAADYTLAKARLGLLELALGSAVLLGWTLLGGLSALNQYLLGYLGMGLVQQVLLVCAFVLIGSFIDLPLGLYQTFVIEAHYGFNRMTLKLWLQDLLKGGLLGALIGIPIVALILWLMGAAGVYWWLWAWCVWTAFNVLAMLIYPTFIAPWFNKFQPLADAALKTRVEQLMQRCGFQAQGLFVMDGSRRSAHGNAYFTGLGASKRVVFFDTLLSRLEPDEVEAVLAHELGHFKHRHVLQRMVLLFVFSLMGFALLGYLSQQAWFYTGLGVTPALTGIAPGGAANNALALLLFLLVMPTVTSFITPVFSHFSRAHEFQADAYAAAHTSATSLGRALLKLYEDNASTLTPDPQYVRYYYSHPAAVERLGRLAA